MDDEERMRRVQEFGHLHGVSDEEMNRTVEAAQDAFEKLRYLVAYWNEIIEFFEAGRMDMAAVVSQSMSEYIMTLDLSTLRWIASGAAKTIAGKLRAEDALDEVDPVEAAEEILRRNG